MPVTRVKDIDLFRPEGIFDAVKAFSGAQSLMRLLVEQASNSEGQPVARSRAWCAMAGVPFFRFSPPLTAEVSLDETDDEKLLVMMWETMVYLSRHADKLRRLSRLLCSR